MKKVNRLFGITILLFVMSNCKTSENNYPGELDNLVSGSSVVFKGKILLLHTVTTDEDDVSNSGVVSVSEVIDAPESFRHITGEQLTVRFTDISKARVGEERLFFTEPYWIGESIGVIEKGSVARNSKLYENKDLLSSIQRARGKLGDDELKKVLKEAKLVVSGRVLKISVPDGYRRLPTEHDPEWKEAEVQIEETLKGKTEGKSIKILFPSSNDMMFLESPKLKEGDEGIFIIRQTDASTIRLIKIENMVLEKLDFIRGKDSVAHIKDLLK